MIGVLALQGDFAEHASVLRSIGEDVQEVRTVKELDGVDGLIIPGGESTTIRKLMRSTGIDQKLKEKIKKGFPVFGTCAGAIILANKIVGDSDDGKIGGMNITANRNAYGRQTESFETEIFVKGFSRPVHAVFIRAPIIEANDGVLAELDGAAVFVRQGNLLAATFHPELTKDTRIHKYFLEMIKKNN